MLSEYTEIRDTSIFHIYKYFSVSFKKMKHTIDLQFSKTVVNNKEIMFYSIYFSLRFYIYCFHRDS